MRRLVVTTLFAVAVLSAAVPSAAQTSGEQAPRTSESEVRGLERLTPEERAHPGEASRAPRGSAGGGVTSDRGRTPHAACWSRITTSRSASSA